MHVFIKKSEFFPFTGMKCRRCERPCKKYMDGDKRFENEYECYIHGHQVILPQEHRFPKLVEGKNLKW